MAPPKKATVKPITFDPKPDPSTLEGRLVALEKDVAHMRATLEKAGILPPIP